MARRRVEPARPGRAERPSRLRRAGRGAGVETTSGYPGKVRRDDVPNRMISQAVRSSALFVMLIQSKAEKFLRAFDLRVDWMESF